MFGGGKGAQLRVLNHGKTLVLLECLIQLIFKPHGVEGGRRAPIILIRRLLFLPRHLSVPRVPPGDERGHFIIQEIMSVVLKQGF